MLSVALFLVIYLQEIPQSFAQPRKAMATVEYDVKVKRFKRAIFISVEHDLLVYRFESPDSNLVDCAISFDREKDIAIEEYEGD